MSDKGNWPATLAACAMLAAGMTGCGALGGKPAPSTGKPAVGQPVTVEDGGDLEELAKAVKTPEDKLILDVLRGYRMLLLGNPDAKSLDKATLKRSRDAYDRLETILRHGGVKSQDDGERVYTITNEDRLSLQEVIRSASQAADKAAREGDWEKARARWKEIVQSKPTVAFSMEEARWGLTLSDALQSSLPDSIKKRLEDVNESYRADIGYEEIGKQVKTLLEIVPDVRLQRELKKLANRAWEKDKQAGRISHQTQQARAAAAAAGTVPPSAGSEGDEEDSAGQETAVAAAGAVSGAGATSQQGADMSAIAAEADSLAAKGRYVAALKSLERAGTEQAWVKEKKARIGDRFCEEKRRAAANSFRNYKKASAEAARMTFLKRTAADLDSCLFYFPDLPVSQKVRKNREMVESELGRLHP